jgi:hypothetical protein
MAFFGYFPYFPCFPGASPVLFIAGSRACWEKELHEAEQRLSEECLVRQFPNGVKHVTVFLEISQQMATWRCWSGWEGMDGWMVIFHQQW